MEGGHTFEIANVSILYGEDLEYVKNAFIEIEDGYIKEIYDLSKRQLKAEYKNKLTKTINLEGHIAVPCFVNISAEAELISETLCSNSNKLKCNSKFTFTEDLSWMSKRFGVLKTNFTPCNIIKRISDDENVKSNGENSKFTISPTFILDKLNNKLPITASMGSIKNCVNLWPLLNATLMKNIEMKTKLSLHDLRTIFKSASIYPSMLKGLSLGCIKEGNVASMQILRLPNKSYIHESPIYDVLMHILSNGTLILSNVMEKGAFIAEYQLYCTDNKPIERDISPFNQSPFNKVEDAIKAIQMGEFVIVVDEESRENEGDLVIAAQDMTDEKFLFMLKNTGGVVCVSMDEEYLNRLKLEKMVSSNDDKFKTAFTVSCDLKEKTTTGISLRDRVLTIKRLSDEDSIPSEFSRPGHVFPLMPQKKGILSRRGHTESSWELCRLANKRRAAAISEIIDETGNTMKRQACIQFAKNHGIVIISTSHLYDYVKKGYELNAT